MKLLLALLLVSASVRLSFAQSSSEHDILLRYYGVKNALTRDNFDSAKLAATVFESALAVKAADHSENDLLKKLRRDAKKMRSSATIEALRKSFKSTSNDMATLVSQFHANGSDTAYLQFCPMQKAYWISDEQEIRNPYYGKKMLFCGQSMKTFE